MAPEAITKKLDTAVATRIARRMGSRRMKGHALSELAAQRHPPLLAPARLRGGLPDEPQRHRADQVGQRVAEEHLRRADETDQQTADRRADQFGELRADGQLRVAVHQLVATDQPGQLGLVGDAELYGEHPGHGDHHVQEGQGEETAHSEQERGEARARFRRKLAEADARMTPEKRARALAVFGLDASAIE
jgi:hypothetical protein